jgi:hypothetical protein
MLKQKEICAKPTNNVECDLAKKDCYDDVLLMIDSSLDYNRVVFFEPSDEEIVRYLRSL